MRYITKRRKIDKIIRLFIICKKIGCKYEENLDTARKARIVKRVFSKTRLRNYAETFKGICSYNLVYNFFI